MSFQSTDKYYPRFIKRTESMPAPVRLIMERTFHSAMWVLETINGADISELNSSVNLFISGLKNREFAMTFKTQLEIAWIDADKFVFGLHKFYVDLAERIVKENMEQNIADFISEVMRYQVTDSASAYNKAATAYINMMLQTLEYLRPDKFAFEKSIYGVGDDGRFLLGPCPYPYSDVPVIELNRMMLKHKSAPSPYEMRAFMIKQYHEQGIEISSMEDFTKFEQAQRIHVTTIASMLSLIKSDTYDILPQKAYCAEGDPILDLLIPIKVELVAQRLKEKEQIISKDGITFVFGDPECLLESLLLKETVRDRRTYILYRLNTKFGDLSGYYDIEDEYFYSVLAEAEDKHIYDVLKALVLSLYASLVLPAFPPLNRIALRMSGPIPIGLLDKKITNHANDTVDEALPTAKMEETKLELVDDGSAEVSSQEPLSRDPIEEANSANLEAGDSIYPFAWYCISKDKKRFEV